MLFGKNKKSEAAAKQLDDELELAISARIAEVVRVAEVPDGGLQGQRRLAGSQSPKAEVPAGAGSGPHADMCAATGPEATAASRDSGSLAGPNAAERGYAAPGAMAPVDSHAADIAHDRASASEMESWPAADAPSAAPSSSPGGFSEASYPYSASYDPVEVVTSGQGFAAPHNSSVLRAQSQPTASSQLQVVASPFALTPDALAVDALMQETSKHLRNMGCVNILVAGQTGVGKSTLINSVFGEQFAKTAAGSPVTQHAEWYSSETVPLRILDTRGLEAKDYAITLHDMRQEIEVLRAQRDERDQLHMAWVCIAAPSSRVQDCEVDIVRVLNKYDIPAIIVLTKDDDDDEFAEIVAQVMDERRAVYASIVPVRALKKPRRPAAGLEQLVVATFTALPAAHRSAFAAAQKINRDLNKAAAEEYVTAASSAAAAAAVIPLPFADMVTLAPIQASMLVGISSAFGLAFERSQVMQLITTVLGCLALSSAGSWAVGTVLKFIPGPGSVLGAALNATVAGTMTKTLGNTYIRFLYTFIEGNGRVPTAAETIEVFPSFFKARRND